MSRVNQLIKKYQEHIQLPWKHQIAAPQRVIFCVYDPLDERSLRLKVEEFEIVTIESGYEWILFDLTNSFPNWIGNQRYAEKYFSSPDRLGVLIPKYEEYIIEEFTRFINDSKIHHKMIVGLSGVGSLYGFIKIKPLIDKLAPLIPGRLVVLFPGRYEHPNNYRLLDGYDGWNYLAVTITSD